MSTVSIRKTTGDDYAAIKAAVDQVIADIGGIEDIIKPGYKVIIKPNLVACPTDRLSGGVTRWEVCLAIYEAVLAGHEQEAQLLALLLTGVSVGAIYLTNRLQR